MSSRLRNRGARVAASAAAVAALALGAAFTAVPANAATDDTISDATLSWGVSDEAGGGAYAGGCNFLSAGVAGNANGSRLWTEADGFYASQAGNVTITKPDANGTQVQTSWGTKCQSPEGTAVSPASTASLTKNQVNIANGTGTRAADGSVDIAWTGSFTIAFYGGMTYWSVTNPVLSLDAAGNGSLTASASGYKADMSDTSVFVPIPATDITLANFTAGTLSDTGFSATPNYLGVTVSNVATPQATTGTSWGSFPQSYVDFNSLTGQSSYWYSSGGSRDAAKPASPVAVAFTIDEGEVTTPVEEPTDVTVTVPTAAEPESGSFGWAFASQSPVSLGTATQQGQTFTAVGALNDIVVTDTRAGGTTPYSWSISASVGDFANGSSTFSGGYLGWTPKLVSGGSSVTVGSAVASKQSGGTGLAASSVLASSNAAASATVGADLSLVIPATTTSGSYSAKLTVTAIN